MARNRGALDIGDTFEARARVQVVKLFSLSERLFYDFTPSRPIMTPLATPLCPSPTLTPLAREKSA